MGMVSMYAAFLFTSSYQQNSPLIFPFTQAQATFYTVLNSISGKMNNRGNLKKSLTLDFNMPLSVCKCLQNFGHGNKDIGLWYFYVFC